jgi:hypothetical protein
MRFGSNRPHPGRPVLRKLSAQITENHGIIRCKCANRKFCRLLEKKIEEWPWILQLSKALRIMRQQNKTLSRIARDQTLEHRFDVAAQRMRPKCKQLEENVEDALNVV